MTEGEIKKPLRILVVEDDSATRESVFFKLQKMGFTADEAEDGRMALEKLRADSSYAGVLLDLRLPQKDGFVFLEEKKNDPAFDHIPVLVFSNVGQPQYVKRTLDLGAKGFLVKAFHSIDEIAEEVRMCFVENKCSIDYE